jgi:hypothetical protein
VHDWFEVNAPPEHRREPWQQAAWAPAAP